MIKKIDEFKAEWIQESKITERVLDSLTDASLEQSVGNHSRKLGQLAWHLVQSIHYISSLGLHFPAPNGGKIAPTSAAIIVEEYRRLSHAMLHALETQWNDNHLNEGTVIEGKEWQNGASLRFLLMHQAHHRGQMTMLMRLHGLRVPDVYGPTYEDWIEKGVDPLL